MRTNGTEATTSKPAGMGLSLAAWAGLGIIFGSALGNAGTGMVLGAAVGLALGARSKPAASDAD